MKQGEKVLFSNGLTHPNYGYITQDLCLRFQFPEIDNDTLCLHRQDNTGVNRNKCLQCLDYQTVVWAARPPKLVDHIIVHQSMHHTNDGC